MRPSDFVFFLSGAAALSYEVVWARLMSRIVGSDAPGAALVFSAFMGGMGLGAWAAAGLARRTQRPVRVFAWIEILVAAWAALTPFLITRLPAFESWPLRALAAATILLPATLLLGATFPLMGRLTIRSAGETASETSAFYGANTLGAACGALLGPFVLMPLFGLSNAILFSAALDVLAAVLALRLLVPVRREDAPEPGRGSAPPPAWTDPLHGSALLFGAASLALEVLLLRIVVSVTGASVYAFSIVTFVFLLGIGLGSRQLVERRTRTAPGANVLAERAVKSRNAVFWAGACLPFLGLAGLLALRYQLGESDLFGGLANRVVSGAPLWRVWAGHALFAALALLPPAIAFGMALPSVTATLVAEHAQAEREHVLGRVYAANTLGALLGSLVAGFVLLPAVGPRIGVAIALGLPLLSALLAAPRRAGTVALAAVAATVVGWFVLFPGSADGARRVVVLANDAHTTSLVEDTPTTRGETVRSLRVNGKSEASTATVDVRLQYLLGHVPALLHGRVERALVIGLGTGMTAGSLLDVDTLRELRIIEISRAVTSAARSFGEWNGAVLDDPRTRLTIRDGRHFLATTDEFFDLVTSDPVHPWTRGSSDLYTLEHFQRMRAVLAPRGVASQWLPLYELSPEDVRTIVATWCGAFEHVSAWLSAYDLVLVGSAGPARDEARISELALPPRMLAHDARIGVASGLDVAALAVAFDADLRELARGVAPMRDDRPVIEFRAPRSSMAGYQTDILRWAIRPGFVAELAPACRPRALAFRAAVERFLAALPDGFTAAADGLGAEIEAGLRAPR